jgi:hypothetical protein
MGSNPSCSNADVAGQIVMQEMTTDLPRLAMMPVFPDLVLKGEYRAFFIARFCTA